MDYDNTNSGVLFKDDKSTHPKAPEYTGNINIDGKELRLAAWVRTGKSGKKFFSLKVSEPFAQEVNQAEEVDEGEVPF